MRTPRRPATPPSVRTTRSLPLALAGAACALALALASAPAVSAPAGSPAAAAPAPEARTEWSQSAAGGTWASTVLGIVEKPEVSWRYDLESVWAAPVTWRGIVYFVAEDSKGRKLFAVRMADGSLVAEEKLGRGERAWLLVSDDGIGVADEKGIQTYVLEEDDGEMSFEKGKKIKGELAAPPTLYDGLVFFTDGKRKVHCADFVTGKQLGEARAGYGRPCVVEGADGKLRVSTLAFGTPAGSTGIQLTFEVAELDRSSRRPEFEDVESRGVSGFRTGPRPEDLAGGTILRWEQGSDKGYYIYTPVPVLSTKGEEFHTIVIQDGSDGGSLQPIATPPAYDGRYLYGFAKDGSFQRAPNGGAAQQMMSPASIPTAVKPGTISVADRVLYLGAAAVESAGGSVLWKLDDYDPSFPVVPIADGRATYVTTEGALVCLADPTITPKEALPPPVAIAGPAPRPGPDGAILADGTFVPGDVEIADELVKIAAKGGDYREVPLDQVAMTLDGENVQVFGDEFQYPVFRAWNRSLLKAYAETLGPAFDRFAEAGLKGDCKTIAQEAQQLGFLSRWVGELNERAEALAAAAPEEGERTAITKDWMKGRGATADAFVEAAKWCQENELPLAATCLLAQSYKLQSDKEVLDLAAQLVDPGFPFAQQKNAPALWLQWSYELLPASGRFVGREDPLWEDVAGTVWAEGSRGLRTKNVTLLCKDPDPVVIGACLRYAEAAVRALEGVLPPADDADPNPLEVRVHKNRKDYLEERSPTGEIYAMPWSAGFYSPSDGVSRFYVTRDGDTNSHVGRSLNEVLVHELTHHYIDKRYAPGRSGSAEQPGYWIVEGFASFVSDQVVDMGGDASTFDNPNVKSVDATAMCAKQGQWFATKDLVDLPQSQFQRLGDEVVTTVYLRSAKHNAPMSQRGIFYEQAASLVYFLMNECGDEGRENVIEYLAAYYGNGMGSQGWERLGFATADELQQKFGTFLEKLGEEEEDEPAPAAPGKK